MEPSIRRYVVSKKVDDDVKFAVCLSTMDLTDRQVVICGGFDPLDPFASFTVELTDYFEWESFFRYGNTSRGLIYDEEQIEQIYKDRFKLEETAHEQTG